MRGGRLRNELLFGLIVVILLSCLATYAIVLAWSLRDFNALVEENDLSIARSYADALSKFYETRDGWSGIDGKIDELRRDYIMQGGAGGEHPAEWRHPKDAGIPLVVTDARGYVVYVGMKAQRGGKPIALGDHLNAAKAEKITARGTVVGYVFFKSMLLLGYTTQEESFVTSLSKSIGLSVGIGLALAVVLATLFASRFVGPIAALDAAVKTVAGGDLSARVRVERKDEVGSLASNFNRMADRLQSSEISRQQLLADIAHELRTPVSIIQANLEMLVEGVYAPDESRLRSLYDETRILTGLIGDLRSLSDLEAGLDARSFERLRLDLLAQESCRTLKLLFDEKGIGLALAPRAADLFVMAEEDRLRQVFRNVLGNALKYAPRGSTVTLSFELVREGGGPAMVRATVADEGEGVPAGEEARIFERFYRVDSSRNRDSGGRGLGLAISERIIRSLGGNIGAYNRQPHGLAVWFEIPEAHSPSAG